MLITYVDNISLLSRFLQNTLKSTPRKISHNGSSTKINARGIYFFIFSSFLKQQIKTHFFQSISITSLISLSSIKFYSTIGFKIFSVLRLDALTGQSDLLACTLTIEASPEPGHVDINAKDIDCDIKFEFDLIEEDRNALDAIDAM